MGGLKSHPAGLKVLFAVEAWERFSYYGTRALLILFMTAPIASGGLGFDAATAGAIYGIYTAAVYLLSLPGGWLADKLIGQQSAVLAGGVLIAAGNLLLAVPGGLAPFVLGLATITFGVGLLKPNVSVMVGDLYVGQSAARRDAGFSIFYFGIYLGAFTAPLVAGTLGESLGYRTGFIATGVAMAFGTAAYARARRHLAGIGQHSEITAPTERTRTWRAAGLLALAGTAITVLAAGFAPDIGSVATALGVVMGVVSVSYFVYLLGGTALSAGEKRRVAAIFILCACAALFLSGLEQAGSTMTLFARDFTDRTVLGGFFVAGLHPVTWYQSAGPCFILMLSPVFAWMWTTLGSRGRDPSTAVKFGLSLVLLGASFAVMALAVDVSVAAGLKAAPGWLIGVYFLQTVGELCLGPIGLAAVTKLAPRARAGQMMGMWFLAAAAGTLAAGLVGGWMGTKTMAEMPAQFLGMAAIGVAAGLTMLLAAPRVQRLMADDDQPNTEAPRANSPA